MPAAPSTTAPVGSEKETDRHASLRFSGNLPNQYFDFGEPPADTYERSPPAYTTSISSPFQVTTKNKETTPQPAKFLERCGWRRRGLFAVLLLLIIIIAIGLGVGLGLGLKDEDNNSRTSGSQTSSSGGSSSTDSSSYDTNITTDFPIGSYSIQTFLDTVTADCVSNSSTWTCYPYSTYAESTSTSGATFGWVIQASSEEDGGFLISSTKTSFSIEFTNLTLELQDQGKPSERYTFQLQSEKVVSPSRAITSDGSAAICNFTTTFQGALYTSMGKSYPLSDSVSSSSSVVPWPYAIRVEEIAASGSGQPTCFDSDNNVVGNFSIENNGQLCDCLYINYGT